jgi:hypothetical protein
MRVTWLFSALAMIVLPVAAMAEPITFGGCSPEPCSPTTIASSLTSPLVAAGTRGAFSLTGTAVFTNTSMVSDLDTQTITLSTTTGGTLEVAFTLQNLIGPNGPAVWTSGFTSNEQIALTHSVTESTFLDITNGLFLTPASGLLGTGLLTASGTEALPLQMKAFTATGPYALTEIYDVTLTGGCSAATPCTANLTIDLAGALAAVPEPASLAILGTALVGFGAWRRRRAAL